MGANQRWGTGMKRQAVYFTRPGVVEVREEPIPEPGEGQVLVQTLLSAISPGTEMLVYRGQFPSALAVDETIGSLSGVFQYPLKYGYSSVGEVAAVGPGVESGWLGRRVFAFHPHESHYLAAPIELLPLPDDLEPEEAVFLPNMETAVNFVMDGRPMIGERVGVLGLGIVGLLTTALLAQHPLGCLSVWDRYALRREATRQLGVEQVFAPDQASPGKGEPGIGFDLVYELSGAPAALNTAIDLTGFAGRVVIGSWYGTKPVQLDLGGRFHRSRVRLISSQVSTLAPDLTGRWDKSRRMQLAWDFLRVILPARWITQRFPIGQADQAYCLIDQKPEETIQVIITYT